jgi:hypothetical protein
MRRGEEDGDQEEKCFEEGSEDLEQEGYSPQGGCREASQESS